MDAVIIDPPADLIAERQRLGLDNHDEVWDGDYHMVPAASGEHQRTIGRLLMSWDAVASTAGLHLRHEWNLIPVGEPGWNDFRVPDLVLCSTEAYSERGAIGPASLVVEIRSPGDESFAKLPFFERLGVGEVLIIDRDTKAIRHWVHDGTVLVEAGADSEGCHHVRCIPVQLRTEANQLVVTTPSATTRI